MAKKPGIDSKALAAQTRAAVAKRSASASAGADPLPGPLLDVLLPAQISACGFTLRSPVASDIIILKAISAPIYQEMMDLGRPAEQRTALAYEPENIWEMFFLWTRPPAEARAALAGGPSKFRELALAATADSIPFGLILQTQEITQAMVFAFLKQFEAAVGYGSAKDGESFPKPLAARTASAGG